MEKKSYYTVQELSENLEKLIKSSPELQDVTVVGEITELKRHESSGHAYLTLRDKNSTVQPNRRAILQCIIWKDVFKKLPFSPKPGDEVEARGSVRLYLPQGSYNFLISSLRYFGEGQLLLQIEQIRRKLYAEGLMDFSRKKPLPVFPQRIGIVTGLTTAALRDILKQLKEGHPGLEVIIAPAYVQGEGAVRSLIAALKKLSEPSMGVQLIILTRGGGSLHDLMPFNDEELCRAVAACPIPVISAVGHQIDRPVCDDVADYAAATPTEAGRKLAEEALQLKDALAYLSHRLELIMSHRLDSLRNKLSHITRHRFFQDRAELFRERYLYLSDLYRRMDEAYRGKLRLLQMSLSKSEKIPLYFERSFDKLKAKVQIAGERLLAYSPLRTLERGYSIVKQGKKILRRKTDVDFSTNLEIVLSEGELKAKPLY
ncbi:MAG: exodeoxyribonuclease VII large subunit [Leptospiraceae bacterium]|nr:exodeoxyribonuclease VII large subunit [Leptospiraceae bacterium]MDW8307167.1 exodeoxyribonuclease VII large subunit [Leptospiraceae bacterium]